MRILIDTEKSLAKADDRAVRGGGVSTALEPSFIQRVRQGIKYMITGAGPETWMGPGQPMQPQAQETQGRTWDFPVGYNIHQGKRPYEGISFEQMRALAENCDILRLVIETRKDQIARMGWRIKHIPEIGSNGLGPKKPSREAKKQIDLATEFLKFPDNQHSWDQWLRIVNEDMLVIDAATIYPRKNRGGGPYALEVFDGATISPKLNADGRTPLPPDVAYQQVFKGVPAVDFSRDELIYYPRNPRSWKVFGYSPVEQVIRTVNIALRRMVFQLQYYTEGNTPEALIGVPKEWTVDQIGQFQRYWDDLLEGNLAMRRHSKFVPGDFKYQATKEAPLKDDFDEWLARVICYAFSVSPQPFVREMNRATSNTAQEMAQKEGLQPLLQWIKNLMDMILWKYFNFKMVEFDWEIEEEIKPLEQAQIDKIYVDSGIMDADEIRDRLGLDPLPEEDNATSSPTEPGANPPPGSPPPDKEGDDAQKLGKSKKKAPAINRDRKQARKARSEFKKMILAAFEKVKSNISGISLDMVKADAEKDLTVDRILRQLELEGFAVLAEGSEEILKRITADGVYRAMLQIGLAEEDLTEKMSAKALNYAKERAAELVGKKLLPDGTIIDNPNRRWAIQDATRDMLRSDVSRAVEEGWSTQKLQNELLENYAFSPTRANMIARTEIAFADARGNAIAYKESGVVSGKEWALGSEHEDMDECDIAAEAGVIPLDAEFPGVNVSEPPAHPRCLIGNTVISAAGITKYFKRWFEGEIIIISCPGMDDLSVTPNHPILTEHGWIPAGLLQEGDNLVYCDAPEIVASLLNPDDHHVKTRIEDIGRALLMAGGVSSDRMPSSPIDFHGDGTIDGEIDIVRANGLLGNNEKIISEQCLIDLALAARHLVGSGFNPQGSPAKVIEANLLPSQGFMCLLGAGDSNISRDAGIQNEVSLGGSPNRQSHFVEDISQGGGMAPQTLSKVNGGFAAEITGIYGFDLGVGESAHNLTGFPFSPDSKTRIEETTLNDFVSNAQSLRNLINALAGKIRFIEISKVVRGNFVGHVYNLQTRDNFFIAQNVIVSNCVCDYLPVLKEQEE